MFAPTAKEKKETGKKSPDSKAKKAQPAKAEPVPDSASPHLTVDDQGNKTLVITGEPEVGTPTVVVDERGNKTIVLNGGEPESSPIAVDGSGHRSIVLRGDHAPASSAIRVDENGRKTIIINGGEESAPTALTVDDLPSTAPPGTSPWHTAPSTPAPGEPAEDRPYWLVNKAADEKPYYLETPAVETAPYWQKREEVSTAAPYWKMDDSAENGPYWVPKKPEKPEKKALPVAAKSGGSGGFAPAIYDASAQAGNTRQIDVWMYKDEKGVVHITNMPADPRFRLFSITVVDIKVQRGLAGTRRRFNQESLRPYIMKAAATYNLDPALIAAIIKSESAFDANAVSWTGAQGLMQLMPKTAREVGCHDPFDPEANIMGGSRYIRWMLDRFDGNLDLAIAAYNCGPTRVAREGKIPNIAETQNYVVIVKRNYLRYQGEF